ncbi:N-acetyl-1-D-myo-inositol-2-amino-2-deoxy-alpha-D-glucopyranoside deacetylase [Intrasporangium sp.]|uniref:N-acetyl-1-D-myo-inositol-2-amino-2-deoxy-alpha- D-glucopyranoside deacetylase n=1 Tax=Intrasporangium sp. TaxID=1925024 RepID=UPI00293A8274|nr:N-acetyl-1-D-myo-inositol-2-amino-2-deoxy-alpha-D-glucopyranoside deacetylase [Intrasporangium sp.]MDV3221403.1 N-acetyl-1-D-myo-inositol-2-amino-2-deoxy-alpha-D-glucopyranoside deacetylase [Intrasporangium sp.]
MAHRIVLVHAHPDDETLTCGTTMAHLAARGDEVHVVTCTLGEEGEVIPSDLAHLEGHPEDLLAPHRRDELSAALAALGARGHILGEDGLGTRRYRDSGMAGSAAAARPEAFVNADLDGAGGTLAGLLRELRPDVVITYDPDGGYGHPDHIQAHRLTRAALDQLADRDLPSRTYEILTPRTWAQEDRAWVRAADPTAYGLVVPGVDDPHPPSVVDDARITHVVEDPATRPAKLAALRAHATQVLVVNDDVHALSNRIARRTTDREAFGRVHPRTWQPLTADGGEGETAATGGAGHVTTPPWRDLVE